MSESPAPVTLATLQRMKRAGEPIACLTCYDAVFARILEAAGVDVLLVGDSLGMVLQGHESTLPVRVADMIYHGAAVARGARRALRVVDMPFMSYASPAQALGNAARLMAEGGAQVVKLEGGGAVTAVVAHLSAHGVPVCGHLGLLPQSVHELGGYKVQGRDAESRRRILADARDLEAAGAALLVLECVPRALAAEVTAAVGIPVIGIGAGAGCDGQVLVLHDMLGLTPPPRPRFVADFMAGAGDVPGAVAAYVAAVRARRFPGPGHGYE